MAKATADGNSRQVQKTLCSLDSPFPKVKWPEITPEDQATIEKLLCSLLEPLGEYRRNHASITKAKQSERRKGKAVSVEEYAPKQGASDDLGSGIHSTSAKDRPSIASHVIVGFNATTQYLSQFMQNDGTCTTASTDARPRAFPAAIFVDTDALAPVLHSHFPLLCKYVSRSHGSAAEVRLVKLPAAAGPRLALSLGIYQAGPILVLEGAQDSRPLVDFVRHRVNPLEVPWIDEVPKGTYRAVQIRTVQTVASGKEQRQKNG